MAEARVITSCGIDKSRLAPIARAMQLPPRGYKDESPEDFSLNTISKHAVAYSCGRLAMPADKPAHRHDGKDLALCRRLATEAARVMKGTEVGMGSEGSDYFAPFLVAANLGEP